MSICVDPARWLVSLLPCFLVCTSLVPAPVSAASKAEKLRVAEELVQEALHREIYGKVADRQQLLDAALEEVPDFAPAMWHRGYVRYQNKWLRAADLPQVIESDARVAAYEHVRAKYDNTVQDQWQLANWCRERGLQQRERAHLTQTLRLDSDHRQARRRLGFRLVDGVWSRPEELRRAQQQRERDRQALAKWRPEMESILQGLHHRSEFKRRASEQRLLDITDPEAIRAMEVVLAQDSPESARLVLRALDKMPQDEAILALARISVLSQWSSVREDAAEMLRERPLDSFAPELLASLSQPIKSRVNVFRDDDGRLVYRHSFFREGQSQNNVMVLDTAYQAFGFADFDRLNTVQRALDNAADRAREVELNVAQQNERINTINDRIRHTLSMTSGQDLPNDADTLWRWWNQYNEVYTQGEKQTRTIQRTQEVPLAQVATVGQGSTQLDCLAAGTQIWTAVGLVAVEQIRIGDLVLAQNVETGELAYKPVLRTTVRPASKLVEFAVGDEKVQTSGGHPFWVSGEGWVKARQLRSGMELHCTDGTARVGSVQRCEKEQESYNLVVADFNTYFVGPARILSHDNTVRSRTDAIVPGLSE